MAHTPVWPVRITDEGDLSHDQIAVFRAWCRRHKGRKMEMVVRPPRTKRSLDQNAYAHKVPFRLIADEMGEEIKWVKLYILGECFGYEDRHGVRLPVETSTSGLTVAKFSHLIEWMPPWALDFFDGRVYIPLPNECDWETWAGADESRQRLGVR